MAYLEEARCKDPAEQGDSEAASDDEAGNRAEGVDRSHTYLPRSSGA